MNKITIPFLLTVLLFSCNLPSKNVRMVLNAAGSNRLELEKVINHYKSVGDKDKLRAAYFLIGNMDDKYALDGAEVRKYDPIFNVFDLYTSKGILLPFVSPVVNEKWDSLVNLYGFPSPQKADLLPDYATIKADYLINNIDMAFERRNEWSWSKNISFDQFCEFMLPYRFSHEPLESWRSFFYDKYKTLRDSIPTDSIYRVAEFIHSKLWKRIRFNNLFLTYPFDIPLDKMEVRRYGACPHIAVYTAMVMRAMGLPVAIDNVPVWANHTSGHTWNTIFLENGKKVSFHGEDNRFGWVFYRKTAKVYRETFKKQNIEIPVNNGDVPVEFLNNHRLDVTHEYTKTYNICIDLKYRPEQKKKYAIICTFNNREWVWQDWGKVKRNKATFRNMGSGIVYMAMYYYGGNLSPASDPFILKIDGSVEYLVALATKTQNMLLLRKYPCYEWIQLYHDDMVDGYFQGANKPGFSDSVTMFTINQSPSKIETAIIKNPAKFRFIRYKTPPSKKAYVAELEFFGGMKSSDTARLTGRVIGFPEVPAETGTSYQNVFDGNYETYFDSRKSGSNWAGLDLGIPKYITKIRYCPRTDTNFILVGDTYELCYLKEGEWISMGQEVASDQFLQYKNVPSGGLYLLHNLSRGKEERIFTYENGKQQVFW